MQNTLSKKAESNLFDVIFLHLSEESRNILKNRGINNLIIETNQRPLFNYINFWKELNLNFNRYRLTKEQKSLVDKDKLSDDVFDQIKEFDHHFLTKEQESLIDNLITDKELKERYKENEWIEYNKFEDVEYLAKRKQFGEMILGIAYDPNDIHNKRLIHQDFHCGNILSNNIHEAYITDLGLSPEVLGGKEYTQASDIYGFGIIAYETCTGLPPYYNISKFVRVEVKV
ncbi:hypothetical protein RhiirA1_465080 [Rhizophagus irregularis]|uniref:Protein kinase domain-containing protein n=1 Tax=Rhizophagus irregularis TaxID=588596 RepID=A0A2N0RGR7_9GLOM|nr:hypothetical protein RhiirA1_465080 [Rhizophagus irregularis]